MFDPRIIGTLIIAHIQQSDPFLPGFKTYLPEFRMRAVLPLSNASRKNRIGENIWAAIVSETDSGDIVLSQTASQYFRRLIECFLCLFQVDDIIVKRVAHIAKSSFVKVSIDSHDGYDTARAWKMMSEQMKYYTDFKMIFIRYDADTVQYIKNSLYPCPEEAIREVIYVQNDQHAVVRVEERYFGLCVGNSGANVAAASKLVRIPLIITPVLRTREKGGKERSNSCITV